MNLTAIAALTALVLWIVLAFVLRVPSGMVHVLYAVGTVLVARRILIGAPGFRS